MYEKKKRIIEKFASVLSMANPDIVKIELIQTAVGDFVLVNISNGTTYKINVDADSCIAMLYDVCAFMKNK